MHSERCKKRARLLTNKLVLMQSLTVHSTVGCRPLSFPVLLSCTYLQFAHRNYGTYDSGNRRRGYAQRMMVLLHEKLALIADISVLYSSIGNFYAGTKREHQNAAKAVGWNLVSPYHVTWQVGELLSREANTSDSSATKQEATKLEETDFDAALQIDADLLIEKVRKSPEASVFTIIPTQDQIDYALISCKFLDQLRFPPSRENFPHYDVFGCQIGRSGDRDWAFAIWRYGPVHNVLAILRLRCNNATQLRVILQTAGKAAAQQGISTITAWNVDEALLEGTGWSNVRRDNHLDALAWYGDGEQPKWLCNENWAHC